MSSYAHRRAAHMAFNEGLNNDAKEQNFVRQKICQAFFSVFLPDGGE